MKSFSGHADIGFEDGRAVPITQPVADATDDYWRFKHLNSLALAERFVAMLEWVQTPNNLQTVLRKLAVLNRMLGIGADGNSSWQEIANRNNCGRGCISKLGSEFQKRFGENKLGPVKPKSKRSCRDARLLVLQRAKAKATPGKESIQRSKKSGLPN